MSDFYARANEAYVLERFEDALELYGKVCGDAATGAESVLARVHCAGALLALGRAREALDVCDEVRAEELPDAHVRGVRAVRRGRALFELSRFVEAQAEFERAVELLGSESAKAWLSKAQVEAAKETKVKVTAKPVPAPAPAPAPATAVADPAAASAAAPAAPTASKVRVREDWLQAGPTVEITVFVKRVDEATVEMSCTGTEVSLAFDLPKDAGRFEKTWQLYGAVDPASAKTRVTKYKVEVCLKKTEALEWEQLESVAVKPPPATAKPPVYSGKAGKINWDELDREVEKEEAEAKPSGDAALNKLFQQIYANATPETRRAMIKSYQTSGGTVLSTNWDEVKDKDYEKEIKPPDGQEVYKPPI